MKYAIIGAIIFCIALIGIGYYAVMQQKNAPRIVSIHESYLERERQQGWVKGSANADSVEVVEYADFQCPACGAMYPIIEEALEKDPNSFHVVYRQFPLPSHDKAQAASRASEAAGRQGAFWGMHGLLYENQQVWSPQSPGQFEQTVRGYAEQLELNIEQFNNDLREVSLQEEINADTKLGEQVPVQGTPTLVINGATISATPRSADELLSLIQQVASSEEANQVPVEVPAE